MNMQYITHGTIFNVNNAFIAYTCTMLTCICTNRNIFIRISYHTYRRLGYICTQVRKSVYPEI